MKKNNNTQFRYEKIVSCSTTCISDKIKYGINVRSILPACDLPCCQVLSDLGDASTKHCRVTCMSTARSTTGLTTRTKGSTVELKAKNLLNYFKDIRFEFVKFSKGVQTHVSTDTIVLLHRYKRAVVSMQSPYNRRCLAVCEAAKNCRV